MMMTEKLYELKVKNILSSLEGVFLLCFLV